MTTQAEAVLESTPQVRRSPAVPPPRPHFAMGDACRGDDRGPLPADGDLRATAGAVRPARPGRDELTRRAVPGPPARHRQPGPRPAVPIDLRGKDRSAARRGVHRHRSDPRVHPGSAGGLLPRLHRHGALPVRRHDDGHPGLPAPRPAAVHAGPEHVEHHHRVRGHRMGELRPAPAGTGIGGPRTGLHRRGQAGRAGPSPGHGSSRLAQRDHAGDRPVGLRHRAGHLVHRGPWVPGDRHPGSRRPNGG